MRFTLLLGLLLSIFSINEINASSIEKDSLNPLYTDLVNPYQLKVENLQVLRTIGKNVKLKYDIVNTGKHIVKLGKGRSIPNTMSVIFDDEIESGKMGDYKAQIAEQILNQDLFLQSGKTDNANEVKVNLSAPATLAHMIGSSEDLNIASGTMERVRDGVGSLGERQGLTSDMDMDVDMDMDLEMDDIDGFGDVADVSSMGKNMATNSAKRAAKSAVSKAAGGGIKGAVAGAAAGEMLASGDVKSAGINAVKNKAKNAVTSTVSKAAGGGIKGAVAGAAAGNMMDGDSDVSGDMLSKAGDLAAGAASLKSSGMNSETDLVDSAVSTGRSLANKTKLSAAEKRKAERDAMKQEALDMKADAAGSEAYDDMDIEEEVEARELTKEELDTSENLETEKDKWYDGFKPYGLAKDDEEKAFQEPENPDEFLDKSACPDLTIGEIRVVKSNRKWATVEVDIINEGKGPALIYGTTPKEGDNVYIKAHLSNNNKVTRGTITLGGMFINKGVPNQAGKLMPGDSMTTQMKIDIKKKTKYTSVLILDLDAFGNCRECDETNNKQHVILD